MLYMLLLTEDESNFSKRSREEHKELIEEYIQLEEEMKAGGHYIIGKPLMPTSTATTVEVRNKKTIMTDGPFTETKEQMAGIYILDCENLDQALYFAAKVPMARTGKVEVRPIMKFNEDGPVRDGNQPD